MGKNVRREGRDKTSKTQTICKKMETRQSGKDKGKQPEILSKMQEKGARMKELRITHIDDDFHIPSPETINTPKDAILKKNTPKTSNHTSEPRKAFANARKPRRKAEMVKASQAYKRQQDVSGNKPMSGNMPEPKPHPMMSDPKYVKMIETFKKRHGIDSNHVPDKVSPIWVEYLSKLVEEYHKENR